MAGRRRGGTEQEVAVPTQPDGGVQAPAVMLTARPETPPHATAVESARVMAEVQAAVVLAKQFPRSISKAIKDRGEVCERPRMAERAFYRYSRGGSQITGPTIDLARALAQVWGNITYGLIEVERNRVDHTSTMQAFAWDLETNVRPSTTFHVPWVRNSAGQFVPLVDPRDIYENNAATGARRVREMILGVIPAWFSDEAQDQCRETLAKGQGDRPLPQRRADMAGAFETRFGVTRRQLEEKLARSLDDMTAYDLVTLGVVFRSLERGETTVGEEFPVAARESLRVEDLAGEVPVRMPRSPAREALRRQQDAAKQPPTDPSPEDQFALLESPPVNVDAASPDQIQRIEVAFEETWGVPAGPVGEDLRLRVARELISPDLGAVMDLTSVDADALAEAVETLDPVQAYRLGLTEDQA
jgi:hypothetical protein